MKATNILLLAAAAFGISKLVKKQESDPPPPPSFNEDNGTVKKDKPPVNKPKSGKQRATGLIIDSDKKKIPGNLPPAVKARLRALKEKQLKEKNKTKKDRPRFISPRKTHLAGLGALAGFFDRVKDLVTLRKLYFELVKQYHPDRHPNESDKEKSRLNEIMQSINAEYDRLSKILPKESGVNFESPEDQEKEQNISSVYKDIVNAVLKFELIKVELIGSWVWISGNTYPIKDELKAAGFFFAGKKKMWYWRPEDKKSKYRGKPQDIDSIRDKYGSKTIQKEHTGPRMLSGLNTDLLNSLNALQILLDS